MAKRVANYQQVLDESLQRAKAAGLKESAAQEALWVASTEARIYREAYESLAKALTPKPRNKPPVSQTTAKELTADKDLKCGTCGNPPDHADHDRTYLKSHDFEPPKAARKKREKKDPPAVIPIGDQGIDGNGLAAEMES